MIRGVAVTRALQTLALLLASVLVAEWVVGTWVMSPRALHDDPDVDLRFFPNRTVVSSTEGWSRHTTNSAGHVDTEPRTDAATRALVLGDSYTAALQLPLERAFHQLVEGAHPDVELINTGRPGANPVHLVKELEKGHAQWQPDAVIVVFNDGDWDDLGSVAALHLEREDGAWTMVPGRRTGLKAKVKAFSSRLAQRSALLNLVGSRLELLIDQQRARFAQAPTAQPPEVSLESRAKMASVLDRLTASALPTLVVTVPSLAYHRGSCEPVFPERTAAWSTLMAERSTHEVSFVGLEGSLCARYAETGQPPHGFANLEIGSGHLNVAGHEVLAEAISHWLDEVAL